MAKKIALLLVTVLMLFAFAACGGGNGGTTDDPDNPGGGNGGNTDSGFDLSVDDPTTLSGSIKVALPSTGNKRAILQTAVDAYTASRTGVTVEVEWKAEDNFYNSYKIDVSGGLVFPDAAFIDHVYVQNLASLDLVADVTSVLGDTEDEDFPYIDNLVKANELDGKSYGFPFNANTVALFYNKELMGDQKVPTTYEEFKTTAAALLAGNPALENKVFSLSTGVDYRNFGAMMFISWLGRNGGQILSDDLRNSNFLSDEVKTTLEQWKEIIDNKWASPSLSNEGNFYNGDVAMLEMGCWKVYDLLESPENQGKYGVAPLFTLKEGVEAQSILGLYSMCVTKQKDMNKMRIAADFSKFISTHTETQIAFAKEAKSLPVTEAAVQDPYFQSENWKPFTDALYTAAMRPGSAEYPTIESEIANMYMKVVMGTTDIDEAMKKADKEVQETLDELFEG